MSHNSEQARLPAALRGVKALIFDMDGTLVDSEINTERAVEALLSARGLKHDTLDKKQFYGLTWKSIGDILRETYPPLRAENKIEDELQHSFHKLFPEAPYIGGIPEFFLEAARALPTAIATSSNRESVDFLLERMRAEGRALRLSAEDYSRSKPDPECYLLAAEKLGVKPSECIVFEDSIPGLRAARAAGTLAVAITTRSSDPDLAREIADLAIHDYRELPDDFFRLIQA